MENHKNFQVRFTKALAQILGELLLKFLFADPQREVFKFFRLHFKTCLKSYNYNRQKSRSWKKCRDFLVVLLGHFLKAFCTYL